MNEGNKKIETLEDASYVGIDLAKNVFGIVVTNKDRKIIFRSQVKSSRFVELLERLPLTVTLFMEGCGMSQFWGRELESRGFIVRIVPAQYVTPFVQLGKKNDLNDAMAVIEAGLKDGLHFVPIKTQAQRDIGAVVCRREQLVENKVRLQNQIHSIFRENGLALNEKKQTKTFTSEAHSALELLKVSQTLKILVADMLEELNEIARKIELITESLKATITQISKEPMEATRPISKMLGVFGVGPVTVATMFAHLGNLKQFKSGRQLSAFLGLTPRQFSSGGKTKLGGISKRGNAQLRGLLVLCANSFLIRINHLDQNNALVAWIQKKMKVLTKKKLVVALANKLARILWAVSVKDEVFIAV